MRSSKKAAEGSILKKEKNLGIWGDRVEERVLYFRHRDQMAYLREESREIALSI